MTCMWKGTIKNGGLICGNDPRDTVFTTDTDLIECDDCKRLLSKKIHSSKHTHLDLDFLSKLVIKQTEQGKYLKNKIHVSFRKHTSTVGTPMCVSNAGPRPLWKITNNPKKITCSLCIKAVWGSREAKRYILKGILIDLGYASRLITIYLAPLSNDTLRVFLDKLINGEFTDGDLLEELKILHETRFKIPDSHLLLEENQRNAK